MALTVSNYQRIADGNKVKIIGTLAFDSSYPTGGEALTPGLVGLSSFDQLEIKSIESGYFFETTVATGGASAQILVYGSGGAGSTSGAGSSHTHAFTGVGPTQKSITMTDDDSASSNGVAVYLHCNNAIDGWFEFVSPTNADGVGTVNNGSQSYMIKDNDAAATGGFQVYFDEDAANQDERLLANIPVGSTIYVPIAAGLSIPVTYDPSPGTAGVAVYFDEDAANSYERLLFVSPTNASGAAQTSDTYFGMAQTPAGTNAAEAAHTHSVAAGAGTEVTNGGDLSGLTAVEFEAVGV